MMLERLEECPACRGIGTVEEENGCWVYVTCLDCGAHTAELPFDTEAERQTAEDSVIRLWNAGKVIRTTPGE